MRPLPYGRQDLDDEDVAAVVATLRGDWLTQGPAVDAFERALCEQTGARFAVAVANGTAALHLACLAAGVRSGDTGVTSTITFVASANCIRYAGGTPFFCDVDPTTGLIRLDRLDERVRSLASTGRAPKVIVPVDLSGSVPDLARVSDIADSVGAKVIEDAAHSLGSTYTVNGTTFRAGSCAHTDMSILSFHPVKHITTGEGGAVMTNDASIAQRLRDLRTHGIVKDPSRLRKLDGPWYHEQHALGFNYRITDIQCALGTSQLRKLPKYVARRRELAALYDAAFRESTELTPLQVPSGCASAYHLYVVRLSASNRMGVAERRLALFEALREAQIFAQVHYIPVHTQPDFVEHGLGEGEFPGADEYYAGAISLPLFPTMSSDDVERVVDVARRTLERTR